MRTLALLHALHENPGLTLHRVGEGVKVLPAVPEEARPVLAHFKPALLQALEDGERVEASRLLSSPFRLLALLAHALGVEAPLVLTLYGKEGEPPRRYPVPPENIALHLRRAELDLTPPRRLHLAAVDGRWTVDLVAGWEGVLEVGVGDTALLLLSPEEGLRGYLQAAARALLPPEKLNIWRRGKAPFTARG
ncbi:hypothetical protein [Thermus sp.]|uniref:hypothetical protein n=1 Tax=Thermus sp. TaxID=275 RepID=UPI003D133549